MEPFSVHLFGLVISMEFYKAKYLLRHIQLAKPKLVKQILDEPLVESEWEEFVSMQKRRLRDEVWAFNDNIMVFVNKEYLGGSESLHFWCKNELLISAPAYPDHLYSAATREMKRYMQGRNHPFVFLDVTIATLRMGSLVFELFADLVPSTCANFKALCTGERGKTAAGQPLCYKGSPVHRIVPGGWIQGGDIVEGNGKGGESIYGKRFDDENFSICHNRRGVLGMANNGPHTNSSQFYVALSPADWMDAKFVAFGQLVFGYKILQVVEELDTFNERPVKPVVVSDAGMYVVQNMTLVDCTKDDITVYYPDPRKKVPRIPVKIVVPGEAEAKDANRSE